MNKIPVIVTVSRETGQVIDAQRAEADRESFRKMCQALIRKEGPYAPACGDSNRAGSGDPFNGHSERTI